jgi:hypothetical protein
MTGPDDAVLVRINGDPHPVTQPELGQDAGNVTLHRRFAEIQSARDLGVRHALGDEPDDL